MNNYKTDKLKGRIIEKFGSQKAFAEAVGIHEATLCRILRNGREFKGSQLIATMRLLDIPAEEVDSYFFESKVSKRKQKRAV